jgi:hypothetical protein
MKVRRNMTILLRGGGEGGCLTEEKNWHLLGIMWEKIVVAVFHDIASEIV